MTQALPTIDALSPFKRQVYYAVEDVRRGNALARTLGVMILVLIVANVFALLFETQSNLPAVARSGFSLFGIFSVLCFAVEYACRIYVADVLYPALRPARARMRYVISPMGIIDLLAFFPAMLSWMMPFSASALNALRVIRLVRLVKLTRYMKGLHTISRVLSKRKHEIVAALMVLAMLTITSSVLMYTLENPVQPDQFDSVLTGLYWAMTTITSTGYGDLVPITAAGRAVGFLTMVLSIAVVAIPAGIFSAGFVAEFQASSSADTADTAAVEEDASA
ncbi:MAG: ion transporter [Raoultibacter sp.]